MKVLVSGANGFVGSHIVAQLLDLGHQVCGTVRDLAQSAAYAHLRSLPGAAQSLELVQADLTADGAFRDHVQGVDGALHVASPYAIKVNDPQRDLVDPAVRGTLAMLEACAQSASVKRVVVTSSIAAITDGPTGKILDESQWAATASLDERPYSFSKVRAERAAWRFVLDHVPDFDLVVINPHLVIGPAMTGTLNPSNKVLCDLINGAYPAIMRISFGFVDVRDVARAHIQALLQPAAQGRYLCAAEPRTMAQVVNLLNHAGFDHHRLPRLRLDNRAGDLLVWAGSFAMPKETGSYLRSHIGRDVPFDNGKIRRDLGIRFRDLDQSIVDSANDLKAWGHV